MNTISSMHTSPYFRNKIQQKKSEHTENNENKSTKATPAEKRAWKDGFLIGATLGAITMASGYDLYNNSEKKDLINDFETEYKEDDTKSLKIEDMNDDEMPDIVVEKDNGDKIIYDFKNNSIGIKMDDEIIEKIR